MAIRRAVCGQNYFSNEMSDKSLLGMKKFSCIFVIF